MGNQELEYVGIDKLPVVAQSITDMLKDGNRTYALFEQALQTPYLLDNDTIDRASSLMTERLEILAHEDKQTSLWKQDVSSHDKSKNDIQNQLSALEAAVAESRQICRETLELLAKFRTGSINSIMEMDNKAVVNAVLSGKLNLP
jgi:hypothetical protein